jgi:hypothetical protein
MDSTSNPLLEGAHGALNLTHVAVRGYNVHFDGSDVVAHALKFVVAMDIADAETTAVV